MPSSSKNYLVKILKVFAWFIASVVLLLVLVALLIQIPAVQRKLTQKAVSFLEEKIGTEVSLEGIRITFPKNILLEGLYLEDQQEDTLLYAGKLSINTDLWALTRNEIQLNEIRLHDVVAFVDRADNDSAYNFSYILDAFAGDSTAVPDTLEQKGWTFSLKTIALEKIRVRYDDFLEGNHITLALGTFELHMDEFDLEKNIYRVDDIFLSATTASVRQTKPPPPEESVESREDSAAALIFSLDELVVEDVHVQYEQAVLGQKAQIDLGQAKVDAEVIDLENRTIDLDRVMLNQTALVYHQAAADTVSARGNEQPGKTPAESEKWNIALDALDFSGNSVQYYDFTQHHEKNAIDFDHLWVSALDIEARDIRYTGSTIEADLRNIAFREHSGFQLKSLRAGLNLSETQANIRDLLAVTENSRIQMQASAAFRSLRDVAQEYTGANIDANINESYINVRDILFFQPTFADNLPVNVPSNANLQIDAVVQGKVNDLDIRHLNFSTLSGTQLQTSGRVSGLPVARDMNINLILGKFHTTRQDMETILPDTLLPDSIHLPAWVNIEGAYRGTSQKGSFNTLLTSDAGTIDLEGRMDLDSASALRGIDADLAVNELAVGKILGKPDSVMGNLSMKAKVRSSGLTPEEAHGVFTASVDRFSFRGYDYRDFKLYGTLRDEILSASASMGDENLDFSVDAAYNFSQQVPMYELTLDVKNANFRALNLSQSPIRGRGTLLVNMATADFKVLNGNVGIRKVAVFNGDKLYAIDSLLFASIDQEGRAEINIESDLLEANFEGSINIFGLPGVVREYLNSYYSLHDSLDTKDSAPQHFSFDIKLKNTDLLTDLLVPNLTSFVPGNITGEFNSEQQRLDLQMEVKEVQYSNIGVKSFVFTTRSDSNSLNYDLTVDRIMVDSMRIDGLKFNGKVADDSLRAALIILDSVDREKYIIAGTLFSRGGDGFELRLAPEGNVLNYQKWLAPANNYMRFGGEKFVAQNVQLVNRREKILIESSAETASPVLIGFRELNLEYLSSMIAEERPLSGLLHGDIRLFPDNESMAFTSDITIKDFRIRTVPWGNLSLQVAQRIKNRFDVNMAISGNQNDVTIQGFYNSGESSGMDITAKVNRFNLPSVQPLVRNQVQDLEGVMRGEIRLKGTTDKPDIDGSLSVQDAQFLSTYLNSTYSIGRETILFVDEGIAFNAFEIADNDGNKAQIDGTILTRTYRDFKFDLRLTTDQFRLLNTTEDDNELFYGKVDIEAIARIRGNMNTPVIDVQIGLADGSDLTYVVPQSEASVLQSEGIVKFVDKTFAGDPFMKQIKSEASDTVKSTFRGIDLTARIELTDESNFTIIIDPATKDQLTVKGNTTLTLKIDPTGDIQLAGRYEITEGIYDLSFYKFVKRQFSIEQGSSLTWSGDPLNAEMDIRAIYQVETAPIELFSNQLTGSDPSELNQYKQRLPFQVYLNITGQLLQPEIAFELEMPMDERNAFNGTVYARLQDINTRESDLNKQVFALLILKRFIADNPFESQAPGGFESTARRSVSKILSEQLNRLSENIKGVELSFDIKSYEDYSTGQAEGQTQLQLGVSKTLFNDRLVVKLSGNIDIEGQGDDREPTDYIGDLALEYKITPDGRFRITGFRNSNYDMIDGELTETGAGLIYVKDYNSLSELFKANAQTKN